MAESTEGKMKVGTHTGEIPIIRFIKKDGTRKKNDKGGDVAITAECLQELKLEESIESYVVFGTIKFIDYGVLRIGNIMREGYDYLELEFSPNYDKGIRKLRFEILNIEGMEYGKLYQSYDIITLNVAQFPAYRNLQVWKVSKGYKNKKISEIVQDIFDNFLNKQIKQYKCENEKGSTIVKTKLPLDSFCIPFWSPHKTLNYLRRYAVESNGVSAGYFCYFDMNNIFNFRSLRHIMSEGQVHNIEMKDIRDTRLRDVEKETADCVRDYYQNFVNKQYYKIGLSGASVERFNWFKKKQYTHKRGYLNRPLPNDPNEIFEVKQDINNMFGFHITCGYRWEKYKSFSNALVYNQLLTSIAAQAQTEVLINGIANMKSGDTIKIKSKVQGINENIEELAGEWFVRGVSHAWSTAKPYTQKLHLSRRGAFIHLG